MSIQDIIEKVQKLRALSRSSNLNEAQNAAAVAEKLIAQYRLSEAELSAEKKISEPIIEASQYLYESGRVTRWKKLLALRLASHYGVYTFNNADYSGGRKKSQYVMIGRETDIQILQYNYEYLVREITDLCDLCILSFSRGVSVERNSFCEGAVDGIMEKLREEKGNVEKQATSAALVILNNKKAEAETFAHKKYDDLKTTKSYSYGQRDYASYSKGKSMGSNIQINSGLGGGSTSKLLK